MGNAVVFDNLFRRYLRIGWLVVIPQRIAFLAAPNLHELATLDRYHDFAVPFRVLGNLIGGHTQFFVCSQVSLQCEAFEKLKAITNFQ